jgi:hypothetical protein
MLWGLSRKKWRLPVVLTEEAQNAFAGWTADRLACEAWNKRMLGFQGPAQPSRPR